MILRVLRHFSAFLDDSNSRRSWYLAFAVVAVGVASLLAIFTLATNVYADGGVGTGGNGIPGCKQTGHWTCYGWGWGVYQQSGPGPTDGFNDGTQWANVQATCSKESQVYVFIIDDQTGSGLSYNYQSIDEGPPQYAGRFLVGPTVYVDHGLANSISTNDASMAYKTAANDPRYGINTQNYTFGSNVAWFCYGYTTKIVKPAAVSISGLVYYYNGVGSRGLAGVPITTCEPPNPTTSGVATGNALDASGGGFSFTLTTGDGFCIRVPPTYAAPNGGKYSSPVITPAYIKNGAPPGGSPPGGVSDCNGNNVAYEEQIANTPNSADPAGCNYGLTNNSDYNIAYTVYTPPPSLTTAPPCAGQNTHPTVTLPDAPVPNSPSGTTGQTGATPTASQQYYQEVPNALKILDAYDQYSGPTHLNDNGQTGWQSTGWQSSHDFTLYYNQYVSQYPYDDHKTTVSYEEKYAETHFYTSSSADYYTCNGGDTGPSAPNGDNGHPATCRHDYTGTVDGWNPCNSGDSSLGSGSCIHYYTASYSYTTGCTAYDSSGNCTAYAPCNNGDSGTPPNCTYSYPASYTYTTAPNHWTCYGNYGGGTSSDCYYYYTGQPMYNWHNYSTTMPIITNTYGGAPVLNECFNRNFTVQQPTDNPATDVTQVSFNSNETPSSVTVNTKTSARFNLNHGITSLRHGMGVNGLSYAGYYYIEKADGSARIQLRPPYDSTTENVGGTVMYDGGTDQTTYSTGPMAVSLPPLSVGDRVCAQFTITPATGEVDENDTQQPGTTSGSVDSTRIPKSPTCTAPVTNEPYARFYGNDVLAGSVFGDGTSTCNTSAGISAFNSGSGAKPGGSGSQLAAMSLGAIQQFASAFLRSAAPISTTGLTFANTTGGNGGNFGGNCTKLPDFYGAEQPANPKNIAIDAIGKSFPAGATSYSASHGNGKLGKKGGITIPAGSSVSVFVDGDVYIKSNITYDQTGWTFDPVSRTTTVPSFYLIVKGNIDIAPGVTQLDGVYIAQPGSGSGGTIRTCSKASNTTFDANTTDPAKDFFHNCNSQLTVNGAFIAQDVKFDRTFSSLRQSVAGESSLNGNPGGHACDPSGVPALNDCSAEIFNFSPETYINMPALQPATSAKKNSYDFITTLSPVL